MDKDFKGCSIKAVDHSAVVPGGNGMKPGTPWSPLHPYSTPTHPGGERGESLSPPKSGPSPYYVHHTANLESSAGEFLYQEPTTACDPKYMVLKCACGRHIVPSACLSLRCTKCAPWTGKRRAWSTFDRIWSNRTQAEHKAGIKKTIIYTVFTTPLGLRQSLKKPKAWQSLRLKAWKLLKDRFGAVYGFEASHPIGDKNDKFHPHLNFLWKQRKSWSPYLDVDLLRKEWSAILGVPISDAYTSYTEYPALIRHWCNYVTRVFPGYHWWTGRLRWYGEYPRKIKPKQIVCFICELPFTVVGYISGWLVDEYYKDWWKNRSPPPWMNDDNITKCRS